MAAPRPTDPTASLIVEASAGTGKTKTLIDRVLALLLAGAEPSRILCITFTKAAAAEMAIRLRQVLGAWAAKDDAELGSELRTLLDRRAKDAERRRARHLFATALDAPGGMRILTVHAFCQSILRRFPLEAGVAPNFDVLDDRTATEMMETSLIRTLDRARGDREPALASALMALTERMSEMRLRELFDTIAAGRRRLGAIFERHGGIEGAVLATHAALGVAPGETREDAIAAACVDAACDGEALRRVATAMLRGSAAEAARAAAILAWLGGTQTRVATFDDYRAVFLTNTGELRKKLVTKKTDDGMPDAGEILAREGERLKALDARLSAIEIATASAALLRFGGVLLDEYRLAKDAAAVLDYTDLILKTKVLVEAPEVAAWILFKLDGGIDHVLIDEAQDTNPEQWSVIRAMVEEFFAGEGARDRVRTLFAVGDGKQSIYSFQGADPATFRDMRRFLEERLQRPAVGVRVTLTESFRSVAAVLAAVDAVFAGSAAPGVVETAETLAHETRRRGEGGLVELWPAVEPRDLAPIEPWLPPVRRVEEDSPRARLAGILARRIRNWIETREVLESKGRPIRAGDVMILVRRRNSFVGEMVRALKREGVPVAGVDRMVLSEQLAVMDLIALGRVALLPEDDLTLACVLKGPFIGWGEEDLFALAHGRTGHLWTALQVRAADDARAAAAHDWLAGIRALADRVPPFEFYARILSPLGGRRKLIAALGAEAEDPIDEFLNRALAFEQEHVPALESFLHWIERGEEEIKREQEQGGQDAVRILTVHGAKGLQAPIVILPDTLSVPEGRESLLWPEKEPGAGLVFWSPRKSDDDAVCTSARTAREAARIAEHNRLLYVAMTRAADRLYICGYKGRRTPPDGTWYHHIAAALAQRGTKIDFAEGEAGLEGEGWRLQGAQAVAVAAAPGAAARPHFAAPDWLESPAVAETMPDLLRPSDPGEAEAPPVRSPLGPDQGRRFRRGTLIHRLLQSLPAIAAPDRAAACSRFLARAAADLDDAVREEIAATALGVVDAADLAEIFGPGSAAEVPIAGRLGGRPVSGQIDRLVVTAERVAILDYKTHRPPPARVEDVAPLYLRQMAAYRAVLRRIYPDRPVEAALLWTDGPRVMWLPAPLLDAHAPAA